MDRKTEIIPEYWKNLNLENIIYVDDEGVEREEKWKGIIGIENEYLISNLGRVKSLSRTMPRKGKFGQPSSIHIKEKILKQYLRSDGYFSCTVKVLGYIKIHQAVAKAFIPNPENKPTVNHKWGVRHDNRHFRLEWFTVGEQNEHAFRVLGRVQFRKGKCGKDCPFSVPIICLNDGKEYDSMKLAADFYGIKRNMISYYVRSGKPKNGLIFKVKV